MKLMKKLERKAKTDGGPRQHNDVIKPTVGEPVRKQWKIAPKGTLGLTGEHALAGFLLAAR